MVEVLAAVSADRKGELRKLARDILNEMRRVYSPADYARRTLVPMFVPLTPDEHNVILEEFRNRSGSTELTRLVKEAIMLAQQQQLPDSPAPSNGDALELPQLDPALVAAGKAMFQELLRYIESNWAAEPGAHQPALTEIVARHMAPFTHEQHQQLWAAAIAEEPEQAAFFTQVQPAWTAAMEQLHAKKRGLHWGWWVAIAIAVAGGIGLTLYLVKRK